MEKHWDSLKGNFPLPFFVCTSDIIIMIIFMIIIIIIIFKVSEKVLKPCHVRLAHAANLITMIIIIICSGEKHTAKPFVLDYYHEKLRSIQIIIIFIIRNASANTEIEKKYMHTEYTGRTGALCGIIWYEWNMAAAKNHAY